MRPPERLWTPSAARIEQAGITRFRRWLDAERGLRFDDYESLWRWSTTELEAFWAALWQFSSVIAHSPYQRVLDRRVMPGARWFPGATLNYAEHSLARARHPAAAGAPAIVFQSETRPRAEISWAALAAQVGALAAPLERLGVEPGDRRGAEPGRRLVELLAGHGLRGGPRSLPANRSQSSLRGGRLSLWRQAARSARDGG